MAKNKEDLRKLKMDANMAKERLMSIASRLEEEEAIRECKSLRTIIGKLEEWQNK